MKQAVFLVFGACWLAAVNAAPSDLVKCSSIDDSVKRLSCYDDLALGEHKEAVAKAVDTLNPKPDEVGKWQVHIDKSKIDDSTSVVASLEASQPIAGRVGRPATPWLIIRCLENVTSAYLDFGGLFMSDIQGYGKVTFRVDKQSAFVKEMDASTNNKALGLWTGGSAIPFIKQILGGETLVVRATPFNDSARTMEFPLTGIASAVAPVRKECKW